MCFPRARLLRPPGAFLDPGALWRTCYRACVVPCLLALGFYNLPQIFGWRITPSDSLIGRGPMKVEPLPCLTAHTDVITGIVLVPDLGYLVSVSLDA